MPPEQPSAGPGNLSRPRGRAPASAPVPRVPETGTAWPPRCHQPCVTRPWQGAPWAPGEMKPSPALRGIPTAPLPRSRSRCAGGSGSVTDTGGFPLLPALAPAPGRWHGEGATAPSWPPTTVPPAPLRAQHRRGNGNWGGHSSTARLPGLNRATGRHRGCPPRTGDIAPSPTEQREPGGHSQHRPVPTAPGLSAPLSAGQPRGRLPTAPHGAPRPPVPSRAPRCRVAEPPRPLPGAARRCPPPLTSTRRAPAAPVTSPVARGRGDPPPGQGRGRAGSPAGSAPPPCRPLPLPRRCRFRFCSGAGAKARPGRTRSQRSRPLRESPASAPLTGPP